MRMIDTITALINLVTAVINLTVILLMNHKNKA